MARRAPTRRAESAAGPPPLPRAPIWDQDNYRRLMQDLQSHRERLAGLLAKSQHDLDLSRQEYEALFDLGPIAAFVLDGNGVIQRSNLEGGRLLRVECPRLAMMPFTVFVSEAERRRFLDHMTRCRRAEDLVRTELVVRPREGDEIPIELSTRAFAMRSGGRAFHTTAVDLRERRRASEARDRDTARWQRAERDQSSATAANDAKDRFLAILSHELRTPLTPVLLATSALRDDPTVPSALRQQLEMIHRNVGIEVRLIDDLLDLTRITQGKLALVPTLLDPSALVREVVTALDVAHAHAIELDLRSERQVYGDAVRVRQILWNLLRNAIRYTPEQGWIGVGTRDVADDRVRIEVSDTGIGFDAEAATTMFEPFSQGSRSVRDGGLGLGLAITRGLVEAHGGTITARSDGVGRGARFIVELPASEPWVGSTAEPTADRVVGQHAPLHVLLVEDHEDTSIALSYVLEAEGYTVTIAHSCAEALQSVATAPIDMIVSDLGLPDGTGLDLMRTITAERSLPGIALTGFGRQEDQAQTRAAGFDRHLTKPVEIATLIAAIEDLRRELP